MRIEPTFDCPAQLTAWLTACDVDDRQGPVIDLCGELQVPQGIFLQVRLAEATDSRGEPAGDVETVETPVLPPGTAVRIPQRLVTPGIGGNPWVSIALHSESAGAEDEIQVGRCVRLD